MIIHNLNPVLLDLGFFEIRYYGLFYVIGFLFSIWWLRKFATKLSKDEVSDLFFYLIISLIIGARLFEVFIYNPTYYFANPSEILQVWHGGLSFHGGLVGVVIAGLIWCKKRKKSFMYIADHLVLPASLAMALVRIGNFINGELYGTISNLPWCVKFKSVEGCRHPNQIYESAYNIVNFLILLILSKKKHKEGFIFSAFIFFYGLLRFLENFVRADPTYFGLSTGQYLCLGMMIVGSIMMWKYRNKTKKSSK